MISTPKPNFFVIGAAKSGTTSLHKYLQQHPQVFMSRVKEPNFFAFMNGVPEYAGPEEAGSRGFLHDRLRREKYGFSITSPEEYSRLFSAAGSALAIGESSVSNMYFPAAATRIKQEIPRARIIAILRHPVDRAYSKYMQFRRDASEPIVDFEEALVAEQQRMLENWSPTWFYIDRGFYYRQLKTYYDLFENDSIHVVLYDDLVKNQQHTLNMIFLHLGVEPFSVDVGQRHNVSRDFRVARITWLHDLIMRPNILSDGLHRALPESIVRAIRPHARRILLREAGQLEYTPLTPEIRGRLTEIFRDDILQLEELLDRDLSHWLQT